ncbi:hypothetical protein [Mycoplasma sp. Mirounga ES2805-ORL]|uniref:hypothetical protein n=1 Tax=Mycoplasma sp. Mirounga ES2805-ORL TaxID=754514 RepID=UPI00197BCDAF|nr:hypothetical protein [Mycoplasma sp. Mirounga ES2805-ORL]QSF13877.1 hypothetical protein JXZ90_01075 [Mycoplasma sp. Mirounga ES2805-ORL]
MKNEQKNNKNFPIPVLKPIYLATEFVNKIKGDTLKSNVMMLIAEDDDDVFFVSCFKELDSMRINSNDIIEIDVKDGINENGETQKVDIAKFIDLSNIFKMNYHDLKRKIVNDDHEISKLSYIGIKNQIEVVNRITEKLNNSDDMPKLVIIKKNLRKVSKTSEV